MGPLLDSAAGPSRQRALGSAAAAPGRFAFNLDVYDGRKCTGIKNAPTFARERARDAHGKLQSDVSRALLAHALCGDKRRGRLTLPGSGRVFLLQGLRPEILFPH